MSKNISNDELKKLADESKESAGNKPLIDTDDIMEEKNPEMDNPTSDANDVPVFIGTKNGGSKKGKKEPDQPGTEPYTGITREELKQMMPDMAENDNTFNEKANEMLIEIENYRKNIMINEGLTAKEADEAAKNRLRNTATVANNKYLEANPNLGIIEIEKGKEGELKLTDEEHDKLAKVKEIHLVLKETKELNALPVRNVKSSFKSKFIKDIEGSIARYSIPLPVLGDLVTFKGAPTIQMIAAVENEDDSVVELIKKKASFIYDRLVGGVVYSKYDNEGKLKMNYTDFINTFKFHDMDMAMYGIICASTAEETETEFGCGKCNKTFAHKYNMKAVLDTKSITGIFKDAFEDIQKNKHSAEAMKQMLEESGTAMRFQSSETGNVYDISFPTIAKVIQIMERINQQDAVGLYYSTLAVFIENVFIYDKEHEDYIQVEGNNLDEIDALLDILPEIPENDTKLLNSEIQKRIFLPKFVMHSTCPECGNTMTNEFSISELVFQRAQDMSEVIK